VARFAFAVVAVALLAQVAPASDGVLEINQTCATSSAGCFLGDAGGFPVTITQAGSYRLTGNLTVPNGNTTAISIGISNVTLDLEGFAILGPNLVNDNPSCSAGGTGIGISSTGESTIVRNGHVRGMGFHGISLNGTSRIEGVIAQHNCGIGLTIGAGGIVVSSQAHRSRNAGIVLIGGGGTGGGLVQDSAAYDNMEAGIQAGGGTAVLGCTIVRNRSYGIVATDTTGIGHTLFYNNSADAVFGPGKNLDCNVIDGTVYCPSHL